MKRYSWLKFAWLLLSSMSASAAVASDMPDTIYIDGQPCSSFCRAWMGIPESRQNNKTTQLVRPRLLGPWLKNEAHLRPTRLNKPSNTSRKQSVVAGMGNVGAPRVSASVKDRVAPPLFIDRSRANNSSPKNEVATAKLEKTKPAGSIPERFSGQHALPSTSRPATVSSFGTKEPVLQTGNSPADPPESSNVAPAIEQTNQNEAKSRAPAKSAEAPLFESTSQLPISVPIPMPDKQIAENQSKNIASLAADPSIEENAKITSPVSIDMLKANEPIVGLSKSERSLSSSEPTAAAEAKPRGGDDKVAQRVAGISPFLPTEPKQTDPSTAFSGSMPTATRIAIIITGLKITKLSDLNSGDIAINNNQSASRDHLRSAFWAAGASGVQLSDSSTKALDRLISGEVSAAVLALVSPSAADDFPDIAGFRIFRLPIASDR